MAGGLREEGTLPASHVAALRAQEALTTFCPRRQGSSSTMGHQAEGGRDSSLEDPGPAAEQHGPWHGGQDRMRDFGRYRVEGAGCGGPGTPIPHRGHVQGRCIVLGSSAGQLEHEVGRSLPPCQS